MEHNMPHIISTHFGKKTVTRFHEYYDPRTDKAAMTVFEFEDDRIVLFYLYDETTKLYVLEMSVYIADTTLTKRFEDVDSQDLFFQFQDALLEAATGETYDE